MNLADLLVALAVAALVLSATLTVFVQGQRAYVEGAARVESQQNARIALARLVREIRQAPSGPGLAPITVAEPSRVVLRRDAEGGAAGQATVAWQLTGSVLRRNAGAGAQPIVTGVRALAFTYLDSGGRVTTAPADVRAVAITLTTAPEHVRPGGNVQTVLATEVTLRNR